MTGTCQVLLVSGSLRTASTNTALLRTVQIVAPEAIKTVLYTGLDGLPHFDPDRDRVPLHPSVVDLRATIRASDAILFCTPEYAGALPGSFKNLLDWTVGDARPGSIYEKPVGWVNVAARGAPYAHDSLRRVLGYVGAEIVEPACVEVPVTSAMVGEAGLITDHSAGMRLSHTLEILAGACSS